MIQYNLDEQEKQELEHYFSNRFSGCPEIENQNTDYLNGWTNIVTLSAFFGAEQIINQKLCPKYPVKFYCPEQVRIEIYPSFAGEIPIIYADDARDFEQLVTNIVHKGIRPENISQTGASFVSGKTIRFIILSAKPYSNVTAGEIGLDEKTWTEKSMLIRRSHECTHFFTKQIYGISNNILHDELMADFIGLYDAFGFYKAEWFLRFMGIITGNGGRMAVYTKDLSAKVKVAATAIISQAAYQLEKWSETEQFLKMTNPERIKLMCQTGISQLVSGI
ncbi:MAG: hypothetical protein V3G42_09840 [Oscillospiraceae bacterium]